MDEQVISFVDRTEDEGDEGAGADAQEAQEAREAIDALYENQRGWFVFGVPYFSANALYNLRVDPSPWLNSDLQPSPVNITNAQVPDPSWEWAWTRWYVDMSLDVDEEGWQYSFFFRKCAWHGNHPWHHSFVRRRRWLRKRVRRPRGLERVAGALFSVGAAPAHTLLSVGTAPTRTSGGGGSASPLPEDDDITDIATLMARVRRCAVDREKVAVVLRFVREGSEELPYLADHMPDIMSQFIYQVSRQRLLVSLNDAAEAARKHPEEHQKSNEPEEDAGKRRVDSLLRATRAADEECNKLEFWSDIRSKKPDNDDADRLMTPGVTVH